MSQAERAADDDGDLEVARNDLGEMGLCDCGGLRLGMGPMSLHFAAEDVDLLVELVVGGRELLKVRQMRRDDAAAEAAPAADDKKRRKGGRTKVRSLLH